jgi:hypothetical protein
MKPRTLILAGALLLTLALAYFSEDAPEGAVAMPTSAKAPSASVERSASAATAQASPNSVADSERSRTSSASNVKTSPAQTNADAEIEILELQPRQPLALRAELFEAHSWAPPPKSPQQTAAAAVAAQAVAVPVAPPLPYVVLGKTQTDRGIEVFLGRGDQVFVVRENTRLEGSYQVTQIRPPNMSLTYLPLKQSQSLSIGVFEP